MPLSRRSFLVAAGLAALYPAAASAADYPEKAITVIVPFAPGGATDTTMRFIAEQAGKRLGQTVIVDNRAGAGGAVAMNALARAKPDGYVLGLGASSPLTVLPHTQSTPYNTKDDFTYISQYATVAGPLAVKADSPFNTFADIVAFAKANPKKLRWSGAAPRGMRHITVESAFRKAGVETTYVPYQGGAQTLLALEGGEIDAMAIAEFAGAYKSGQIKLIVRTDPTPIAGAPNLPTLQDLGYSLSPEVFYGLIGPAKLPPEVTAKWDGLMKEIVTSKEFVELSDRLSLAPSYADSRTFGSRVAADYEGIGAALKQLDLK